MTCSACGAWIDDITQTFCDQCGAPVDDNTDATANCAQPPH
jgi:predicted amidophosphoribosyltransferase